MKYKVKHVHFVGIGGSGMSGIAEVMHNLGFVVSGSDLGANAVTRRLQALGIGVSQGHAAENVADADVVIVSSAVKADNPEVVAARVAKVPVVPRAMMLAELMRLKQGIAVAGTHGKTTTTSLVASILAEAGMDPTFVIGGKLEAAGSHARLGAGDFLVAEADESDASFLHLSPVIAVVTNIDADHMETYGHYFGRLRQAFLDFVQRLPFYGTVVLCVDDPNVREIMPAIDKLIVTYGLSDKAQIRATDIHADAGRMRFRVERKDVHGQAMPALDVVLNLAGQHNVLNALAAIAVGMEVGVPDSAILKALAEFKGVGRRFQRYGDIKIKDGSFTLIDDYGHHPAELKATIAAARGAFPKSRLVLAFQPHRYTRTRDCFDDFVEVLSSADTLLLTDIYAAGEAPIAGISGEALANAITASHNENKKIKNLFFVQQVSDLPNVIHSAVKDGDVVLIMGAGSIGSVAPALASDKT